MFNGLYYYESFSYKEKEICINNEKIYNEWRHRWAKRKDRKISYLIHNDRENYYKLAIALQNFEIITGKRDGNPSMFAGVSNGR